MVTLARIVMHLAALDEMVPRSRRLPIRGGAPGSRTCLWIDTRRSGRASVGAIDREETRSVRTTALGDGEIEGPHGPGKVDDWVDGRRTMSYLWPTATPRPPKRNPTLDGAGTKPPSAALGCVLALVLSFATAPAALGQGRATTLVVATPGDPPHLDPSEAAGVQYDVTYHIYRRLYNFDRDMNPQFDAVKSEKVSDDDRTWTLELRPRPGLPRRHAR